MACSDLGSIPTFEDLFFVSKPNSDVKIVFFTITFYLKNF